MTISYFPIGDKIGPRIYTPVGPVDTVNGPFYEYRVGSVIAEGDGGAEFVYVKFTATAGQVLNQGDLLVIDNNFTALKATSTNALLGMKAGTFFVGGRFGGPQSAPFSFTFKTAGDYGLWVQTDGTSLLNVASTGVVQKTVTTTATAGQADAPTGGPAVGTKTLFGAFLPAASYTFTADTTNTSKVLKNISTVTGIYPNQAVSGTGIAANSTIVSIDGNPGAYTITLNNAATATGSTITITATGYLEAYLNDAFVSAAN
ncbi:MAG: hypothetical protein WC683_17325 [bacterium]